MATSGRAGIEGPLVQLPATENNAWGSGEQLPAPIKCQPSGHLHPPVRRRVCLATSAPLTRTTLLRFFVGLAFECRSREKGGMPKRKAKN